MNIRRADKSDIPAINKLLYRIEALHAELRPDIFKAGAKKYSDRELAGIFEDYSRPSFVAVDGNGSVTGYIFCEIRRADSPLLHPVKTLYIENICVDESVRRQGVGTALLEYVFNFAKAEKCYNVTLKAWNCNTVALAFYEKAGLKPQQITLEKIIK